MSLIEAKSHLDDDKVGRYFSAISNEANLREKQYGWLMLEPGYAPPGYRNPLLANVMRQFSMIDTAAMGIRKVFKI